MNHNTPLFEVLTTITIQTNVVELSGVKNIWKATKKAVTQEEMDDIVSESLGALDEMKLELAIELGKRIEEASVQLLQKKLQDAGHDITISSTGVLTIMEELD